MEKKKLSGELSRKSQIMTPPKLTEEAGSNIIINASLRRSDSHRQEREGDSGENEGNIQISIIRDMSQEKTVKPPK